MTNTLIGAQHLVIEIATSCGEFEILGAQQHPGDNVRDVINMIMDDLVSQDDPNFVEFGYHDDINNAVVTSEESFLIIVPPDHPMYGHVLDVSRGLMPDNDLIDWVETQGKMIWFDGQE